MLWLHGHSLRWVQDGIGLGLGNLWRLTEQRPTSGSKQALGNPISNVSRADSDPSAISRRNGKHAQIPVAPEGAGNGLNRIAVRRMGHKRSFFSRFAKGVIP